MKTTARVSMFLLALAAVAMVAAPAIADPLPGEFLKFQQQPMIKTVINQVPYFGHDEFSTARFVPEGTLPAHYEGVFMADDFADTVDQPVVHVTWWGSYLGSTVPGNSVQRFLITFESDIEAGKQDADGFFTEFSRPGVPLLNQIVTLGDLASGSGTFTEQLVGPAGVIEPVYKYNAELAIPFPEKADTVYWLKIVALLGPNQQFEWGWHNRDYTIKDPYASPAVLPGEVKVGDIPDLTTGGTTPIYHFQDDAVTGRVQIFPVLGTSNQVDVFQDRALISPTHYVDGWDGPGGDPVFPGIGHFSKDLAFELHAVPEPSTLVLLSLGLACLVGFRWRKE
jgi:hypothetical protein